MDRFVLNTTVHTNSNALVCMLKHATWDHRTTLIFSLTSLWHGSWNGNVHHLDPDWYISTTTQQLFDGLPLDCNPFGEPRLPWLYRWFHWVYYFSQCLSFYRELLNDVHSCCVFSDLLLSTLFLHSLPQAGFGRVLGLTCFSFLLTCYPYHVSEDCLIFHLVVGKKGF